MYQIAKLRMLVFYYDFLYKFIDRSDFEMIQMDKDGAYLATTVELIDIIKPIVKE